MFEATFNIKAKAWMRAGEDPRRGAGKRRYLPTEMRKYYEAVYFAFVRKGLRPIGKTEEYGMEVEFHFVDKRWRDTTNLLKAIEDSGQPSKWNKKKLQGVFMPDLWDDKIFADSHGVRFRGSDSDKVVVKIWKLKG